MSRRRPPPRSRQRSRRTAAPRMRGRSVSEQRWLRRQQTDPFVAAAAKEGYRSRSAYKLAAIDDRHDFLRRSRRIVDLGSAPGGWLQVAVARAPTARIVALDLQTVAPVGDAIILEGDAFAADATERLRSALGGPADAVLSDMAPPATGHRSTDQLRSLALAEARRRLRGRSPRTGWHPAREADSGTGGGGAGAGAGRHVCQGPAREASGVASRFERNVPSGKRVSTAAGIRRPVVRLSPATPAVYTYPIERHEPDTGSITCVKPSRSTTS